METSTMLKRAIDGIDIRGSSDLVPIFLVYGFDLHCLFGIATYCASYGLWFIVICAPFIELCRDMIYLQQKLSRVEHIGTLSGRRLIDSIVKTS